MTDFASFKANWRPKSENIREIAAELNLGFDSLVFIDEGVVVEEGPPREILSSPRLARTQAFLSKVL